MLGYVFANTTGKQWVLRLEVFLEIFSSSESLFTNIEVWRLMAGPVAGLQLAWEGCGQRGWCSDDCWQERRLLPC